MSFKRFVVTTGQLFLVIAILIFVGYRVALNLDMVPEGFSPSGIARMEYQDFKKGLAEDANPDDFHGKVAIITYNTLNRIEKYIADRKQNKLVNSKYEAECEENSIMRFFMFMGSSKGENARCMPRNLQLKHSMQEIAPAKPDNSKVKVYNYKSFQSTPQKTTPATSTPLTTMPKSN